MEFAQYLVVPSAHRALLERLVDPRRLLAGGRDPHVIAVTEDASVIKKLPVALSFNNDEYAAWGFTLTKLGKVIANGIFGENMETGISLDDNVLEGDLGEVATAFGADQKKLEKLLAEEYPDVDAFSKLLRFGLLPVTPWDFDQLEGEEAEGRADVHRGKSTTKKKLHSKAKTKAPATKQAAANKTSAKKPPAKKVSVRTASAKRAPVREASTKKASTKRASTNETHAEKAPRRTGSAKKAPTK